MVLDLVRSYLNIGFVFDVKKTLALFLTNLLMQLLEALVLP